ncbi:hypothetical protein OG455_12515 [Kitasatospora sp. NBC_01287]|uniref:hypothetical protein n=1 Tax=Kitasatospora sp. NBC_01287 TaxID=2903573 RepID=UPI00224E16A1|nr:hypothetical protein [Kitasatospora sp. NBC_01287]MCX4746339.1 hypothetical protein [Kitasatospora sp. NBC_01287]
MATPAQTAALPPGPGGSAPPPYPTQQPQQPPRPPAPPRARRRDRWRAAARTAPGQLRLTGTALVVLVLGFGALTGWQVADRSAAAEQVVTHSQPLSQNATEIYRSLADADTTAAAGFLLAGDEPREVRQRYQDDLANAARLLTQAAAQSGGSGQAQTWIDQLNAQLPVYSGLVETARTDDRQGLPLGAAYLSYASGQMQGQLLPAAQHLSEAELARLTSDYRDARATPWAAYVLGVLVLAALLWFQARLFRRTNRVVNPGLLGATAAVLAVLLWLTAGVLAADSALTDSLKHGSAPLQALNLARVQALQARTAENLNLVARGSTTQYADQWTSASKADSSALAGAQLLAPAGAVDDIKAARDQFALWTQRHGAADALNNNGDYDDALQATVGSGPTSAQPAYQALDQDLAKAVQVEQAGFLSAAKNGRDATGTVVVATAVLALLGAAGVLRGIGRRLAEYR